MEQSENELSKEKIELLKYFHQYSRNEADFLRNRQDKIFTWSSNILFALIGALLIIDQTKIITLTQNRWSKIIASLVILLFTWFAIHWQNRNREWQRQNLEVVTKINHLLHTFTKGYFDPSGNTTLLPEKWKHTGQMKRTFIKRIRAVNYVSATAILGILAVIMLWVTG